MRTKPSHFSSGSWYVLLGEILHDLSRLCGIIHLCTLFVVMFPSKLDLPYTVYRFDFI